MEQTTSRTYQLNEVGVARMREVIEGLQKIAAKLEVPGPEMHVSSDFVMHPMLDEKGKEVKGRFVKVFEVTLTGLAPKLSGWEFIATLQHERDQEHGVYQNVVRAVPGLDKRTEADLETYRDAEPWCDHCNTVRQRKDTYVVREVDKPDADGEWKQVGGSCLKDFLGHKSPNKIAAWLETLMELDHIPVRQWEGGGAMRAEEYVNLEWYLAHVSCMMRKHGWTSSKKAQETGDTPTWMLASTNMQNQRDQLKDRKGQYLFDTPTAPDVAMAQATIEWVRTGLVEQEGRPLSGYENNLKVACRSAETNVRNLGIVGSAVIAYKMRQERAETKERLGPGKFIGALGQKVEVRVFVKKVIPHPSEWGVTNICIMEEVTDNAEGKPEPNGNKLVWFASGGRGLPEAKTLWITGTVKKHSVGRNGQNETVLTRVRPV